MPDANSVACGTEGRLCAKNAASLSVIFVLFKFFFAFSGLIDGGSWGSRIMSSLILNLTSDASVRGMVAPDGSHRFSVYDFITMACQKADGGVYARKIFSRLVTDESDFKNEIVLLCHNIHFPGGRGAATPTMTLRGLQRLLFILGTKVAAEFRALLEGTFTRVMAGDTFLRRNRVQRGLRRTHSPSLPPGAGAGACGASIGRDGRQSIEAKARRARDQEDGN